MTFDFFGTVGTGLLALSIQMGPPVLPNDPLISLVHSTPRDNFIGAMIFWVGNILIIGSWLLVVGLVVCLAKLTINHTTGTLVETTPNGAAKWTEPSAKWVLWATSSIYFLASSYVLPETRFKGDGGIIIYILLWSGFFAAQFLASILPALYHRVVYGVPLPNYYGALKIIGKFMKLVIEEDDTDKIMEKMGININNEKEGMKAIEQEV